MIYGVAYTGPCGEHHIGTSCSASMSGKHIGASIFVKSKEFVLKLAATPLQTRSNKFFNTKNDAPSVTNAHSRFARSSNMMFPASSVTAQGVNEIEIGGRWRLGVGGTGKGEIILYSCMLLQNRRRMPATYRILPAPVP